MDGFVRMRSSVACLRCRRSKIKCDNSGRLDAPCENCSRVGQECQWPGPTPVAVKRSDNSRFNYDVDSGPERKKIRRNPLNQQPERSHQQQQQQYGDIKLIQSIDRITWDCVINTYERHFATELSFLHTPTLKKKIYDLAADEKAPYTDFFLVLLGLLALTSRYHPELDKYISRTDRDNNMAFCGTRLARTVMKEATSSSEYFAKLLGHSLGSISDGFSVCSVERVQALLMLGLYEWTSPNQEGLRTWMLVGAACRMAQALKLGLEQALPFSTQRDQSLSETVVVNREVRRRTMFSCFIFDRLIACGKERMPMLRAQDLHIQLPCEKMDFDLSRDVTSMTLSTRSHLRLAESNPSILGWFVQLVDIWGSISEYCNTGGRHSEQELPPWNSGSRFYQLRCQLEGFFQDLTTSRNSLTFSPSNYFRHENGSGTYVLLHMLLSLCQIMLHREYVPFIALGSEKPSGPLDEPTFPPQTVPPGFWEESAEKLFKATRTIIDLTELSGDNLPHSPLVAFVVYTACFNCIYSRCFPQMDTEKHLGHDGISTLQGDVDPKDFISSARIRKKSIEALEKLAKYSGVASIFVTRVEEVETYFTSIIEDFYRNRERLGSDATRESADRLSVRLGGNTGGFEEWAEKSDGMIGNSTILKTDQSTGTVGCQTVTGPGDQKRPQLGGSKRAQAKATEVITIDQQSQISSEGPTNISQVEDNPLSLITNSRQTSLQPHEFVEVSSQAIPLKDVLDSNESMFMPPDQNWDWTFLNDMYMGSIDLETYGPEPHPGEQ